MTETHYTWKTMPGKVKPVGAETLEDGLAKSLSHTATGVLVYTALACPCVPVNARATYTPFFASQVYVKIKFVKNVYV